MYRIMYLPHVADIRMKIEGRSESELFAAALEGMNRLLKKDYCRNTNTYDSEEIIKIASPDITSLLIEFLSEVLTLSHIKKTVYCKSEFSALGPTGLEAIIYGKAVRYFNEDIKAVTYHEAKVIKDEEGKWATKIVFDI